MSLVLTQADVADLTGKVKAAAQARELAHMGIPYRRRRNGSIAVLRIHVEVQEGAVAPDPRPSRPRVRLDA
jgi:hypothetical protein